MWVGAVDIPTEDGKRRRRTVSSKDKATALAKLRTLRSEITSGKAPTTSNTTLEQWLTHWLETIQKPRVRPTTFKYYETTVRLYILPFLNGSVRLGKLTPAEVRKMIARNGTRNAQKAHQTLVKALGDAMDEGMLDRNVAAVVDKPRHVAEERQPFTFAESRQIITTAFEINDPWATMWTSMFFTAARQGEIIGMESDRCDLIEGLFDFGWQLQQLPSDLPKGFNYRPCYKSLVWTKPKNKAGDRIAPMTAPVWAMMKTYVANDTRPNPTAWYGGMKTVTRSHPLTPPRRGEHY